MKQVQRHEIEAYLGDHVGDYDVDGIIRHCSTVGPDGNRYWLDEYEDADEFQAPRLALRA